MPDEATGSTPSKAARPPGASAPAGYLPLVGGLLVLIAVMLAVLWQRERSARHKAEATIADLIAQRQQVQGVMSQLLSGGLPGMTADPGRGVIHRDDLVPGSIPVDGATHPLFKVSSAAGRRLGFLPGDVIVVAPEPPATASAPAAGP